MASMTQSSIDALDSNTHIINSLALKCALELGIFDAVHEHGAPISHADLATALSIPACRLENFQRFMRLLVHNGFFTLDSSDPAVDVYALTVNSSLLIKEKGVSITPSIELMLDESLLDPWQSLSAWFKSETPSTAFEMFHKTSVWDATGTMPKFGKLIREGLGSDSGAIVKVIVEEQGELFKGVKSMVEVAGGTETMALRVKEAFPGIDCTVLDLPHMINAMEKNDKVKYVSGDMFEYVPPADMLILKWVLHRWHDEACVKLLKRCKEAIPPREKGGKAIIIDKVMNTSDGVHPKLTETQLHFDIHMMVHTTGKQRTEDEWKKLFATAGFTGYNIIPALGLRSIIEIYY